MLTPDQAKALKVGDRVAFDRSSDGRGWRYAVVVRVGPKSAFLDNRTSIAFSTGYARGQNGGCTTGIWRMPTMSFARPAVDQWKLYATFEITPMLDLWHKGTDHLTVKQLQAIAKILGVDIGQPPKEPDNA